MSTTAFLRRNFTRLTRFEQLENRLYLSAARAAAAVNSFGMDLYEQLKHEEGNLFFSPLSISTALAMTYAGAGGQTAAEMEQVLHLGTEPGIHESFVALLDSLSDATASADGFLLDVANAIWPKTGFRIREEFVRTIETDYDGAVQSLDYSDLEQARQIINGWVEDKTHGKVQELLKVLDPNVVMVLTNSLYFQADWQIPFDPALTYNDQFRRANGQSIAVPFLAGRMELPAYTRLDGFQVLEMPLEGGRTSMVFALPMDPEKTPNELTAQLLVKIDNWLETPRDPWEMNVLLPKFSTTVAVQLEDLLAGMGMPTAFTLDADFSKMTPADVAISQVRHKAFLEMDEEGAEAAAATAVQWYGCFAAGTLVQTPGGAKPIEQIQVGDYVLSRDENDVAGKIEPKLVENTTSNLGTLINLQIGGQILRATREHPFFVNAKGWTPAGQLRPGDLLATDLGKWLEVENVSAFGEEGPIYNLRVADHHTYFVTGKAWRFAVWTHNEYSPTFFADHAFSFMIRDNTTNTMLFMGRIDDPTQAENDLEPIFASSIHPDLPGDYNFDRTVDAADYVVWRNTMGNSVTAFSGADGNGNGKIDQPDHQVWRANFGRTLSAPQTAAAAWLEPVVQSDDAVSGAATGPQTVEPPHAIQGSPRDSPQASEALFALFAFEPRPRHEATATPSRLALLPTHTSSNTHLLLLVDDAFADAGEIQLRIEAFDAAFSGEDEIELSSALTETPAGLW